MKVKVARQTKRAFQFYRINFRFAPPFKVILDGSFIKYCIDKKIDLKEKIEKITGGRTYIMVTQCIISELQSLGEDFRQYQIAARRFPKEPCKHEGRLDAGKCLKELCGNENEAKVIIATIDQELIESLRCTPGIPIILFVKEKMMLDDPSVASYNKVEEIAESKGALTKDEKQILKPVIFKIKRESWLKRKEKITKMRNKLGIKLKKKAKGPNPMSLRRKSSRKNESS